MSLIAWREEFALGIPGVDHEHRELIEIINQIHDEAHGGGGTADLVEFLGELHAQISAHFALEEKMMRDRDYAHYAAHKVDHERLLEEIHEMIESYEAGSYVDLDRFSRNLDGWFSGHFREQDARLHRELG